MTTTTTTLRVLAPTATTKGVCSARPEPGGHVPPPAAVAPSSRTAQTPEGRPRVRTLTTRMRKKTQRKASGRREAPRYGGGPPLKAGKRGMKKNMQTTRLLKMMKMMMMTLMMTAIMHVHAPATKPRRVVSRERTTMEMTDSLDATLLMTKRPGRVLETETRCRASTEKTKKHHRLVLEEWGAILKQSAQKMYVHVRDHARNSSMTRTPMTSPKEKTT